MELTWLDDFLALEQARNFTRAADMRHTTQSAYSRRVARLEDWLGCRLFERDTRPVELTPEGQEFLTRARMLRADILDARRALQVLGSHYAHAHRIYTTGPLAMGFLPHYLQSIEHKPLTVLVASVTGCLEALMSARSDFILVPSFSGDVWPDHLARKKVGQDELVLMARKDIASKISVHKSRLSGPMMMYTPSTRYGKSVQDMMLEQGMIVADSPVCESAAAEALVAQVKAGIGAAFIPRMLADSSLVVCEGAETLTIPYDILLLGN